MLSRWVTPLSARYCASSAAIWLPTNRLKSSKKKVLQQYQPTKNHLVANQQVWKNFVRTSLLFARIRVHLCRADRFPLVRGERRRVEPARELGDGVDDVLGSVELGVVDQQWLWRLSLLKESNQFIYS